MRDEGRLLHSLMGSLETDQLNKDTSCQARLSDLGKLSERVITLMIQMRNDQVIYVCMRGNVLISWWEVNVPRMIGISDRVHLAGSDEEVL